MDQNEIKQRDRPSVRAVLSEAWEKWSPGVLLGGGAIAVTVGAALLDPSAGWITGGVLAILGGILDTIGGGERK